MDDDVESQQSDHNKTNPREEELEEDDSCEDEEAELARSVEEQDMDDNEDGQEDSAEELNDRQNPYAHQMINEGELVK